MKAAALITGLFISFAGVLCAKAEPASKDHPQGEWTLKPIGPQPEKFTKDFETKQCGKKYCWAPLHPNHLHKGFEHGRQPTVNSDTCRKSHCT